MKNSKRMIAGAMGLLLAMAGVSKAADWPCYRGANTDGVCTEKLAHLGGNAKIVWKVPTNLGFSSFAVAGGKVFTQVTRGSDEVVLALDAKTGKDVWTCPIGPGKYPKGGDAGARDNNGGDGARSTPTVSDGMVYAFTPDLVLNAIDASSGKKAWTVDLMKDHAGRNIGWKSAASPVVDGDLVFIAGGGAGESLMGIDKKTGKIVWKGEDETITHATPTVATILGQRQVIFFMKSGLVSVAPDTGKVLWKFRFDFKVSTAASPVVCGDIVYCSAGYGVGAAACRIAKSGSDFTTTEIWRIHGDKPVANHWSTPVFKDGYLYGMFSFKEFGNGKLKCVEVATGKVMWERAGFGAGQAILADGKVVALSDAGEVVIVDAVPGGYKEIARAKVVAGKCWSTPALADGRLYVRSTKEGACVDLSGK